jgi:hypothetical protein
VIRSKKLWTCRKLFEQQMFLLHHAARRFQARDFAGHCRPFHDEHHPAS